ncbi:MAG: hypothetical protein WH035_02420 [Spirochaetota bacterium]
MKIAIHITHEAVQKIGGIGSVINGVCTADNYKQFFNRTLLYGPAFSTSADVFSKLGRGGQVLYSNQDSFDKDSYHTIFSPIIEKYAVDIIYGIRTLASEYNINKVNEVEVLLVNVQNMKNSQVDIFKYILWERYGIQSDRFTEWDYEQYIRIGACYFDLINALYGQSYEYYHFSHEYMGIPSVLKVISEIDLQGLKNHKSIFWAHEVSPARSVVENYKGHDISFYNILRLSEKNYISMESIYPEILESYRTQLVKRTVVFDYIFAVSNLVASEYKFLNPQVKDEKIKIIYNGISFQSIDWDKKKESREKLRKYIESIFNFNFDVLFTHVTRLVLSKGIWRDFAILEKLDDIFHSNGLKGAYILLSTLIGTGRNSSEIHRMEKEYGWPALHRKGWPDCVGYEEEIYDLIQLFNAKSKSIKALFINQFGFDTRTCGDRVPLGTSLLDLRIASDAELGYSIYEPFGISQIETIPYGGFSFLSRACGSSYLFDEIYKDMKEKPYHVIDFSNIENIKTEQVYNILNSNDKINSYKNLDENNRRLIEESLFNLYTKEIFDILPKTDSKRKENLENISYKAINFSWESRLKDMFNFL